MTIYYDPINAFSENLSLAGFVGSEILGAYHDALARIDFEENSDAQRLALEAHEQLVQQYYTHCPQRRRMPA